MEEKATIIESLFEKIEAYVKTNIELFRLKAIDKSASLLSTLASTLIIFIIVLVLIILLNIGLALWIGGMLGESYYGFFIVALFYFLVMLILLIFKGPLIKGPISNSIISNMTKEKKYDTEQPN